MPAPFSIEDLESDPGFRGLSLEDQARTRDSYFQTYVAQDPGYASLAPESQAEARRLVVDRDPILDDPTAGAVQQVQGDIAQLGSLDPQAAQDARARLKTRYLALGATKDSLVANILALGEDVISELWDPKENHFRYTYGREGEKLNALTLRALAATSRDPEEVKALAGWTSGLAIVTSIAESLIPIGAVGQLGKAGWASGKAFSRVAATAAKMTSGPIQRFVASAGEQTVQAFGMAAYSAVQTLVVDGAQDGWSRDTLPKLAESFGKNLATDYALWMGMSALGISGKFVKALRGSESARTAAKAFLDMPSEKIERELAQTLLKTGQVPEWAHNILDPEYLKALEEDLSRLRASSAAAGLRSKEDVGQVLAQSLGVETRVNEKGLVEGFEAGSGEALGTWRSYDELCFDLTHNVAPKKGELRAPTAHTSVRAKDTVAVEDVDEKARWRMYGQELEQGGVAEIEHALGGLTGMKTARVKDLFGTREALDRDVSAFKLDDLDRVIIDKRRLEDALDEGARNGVLPVPEDGFRTASDGIAYISALQKLGYLEKGSEGAMRAFGAVLGGGHGTASPVGRAGIAATWGVAKRLFGGEGVPTPQIETLEGGVLRLVQAVEKDGQKVKQVLHVAQDEPSLRAWLMDQAIAKETLPLDDLAGGVASLTGARLARESQTVKDAAGKPVEEAFWALRTEAGRLVDKAASLEELLGKRPEIKHALRYPASYAPKVYIADPAATKLTFEGAVAYGQTQDLLLLGEKFGTPFTGPKTRIRAGQAPDGRPVYLEKAKRTYTWTPYDGAVPRKAASLGTLQNIIAREKNSLDGLRKDAGARGAQVVVTRDGRVGVIEQGGELKAFRTRRDAEAYFAQRPVLDETKAAELVPEVQWDKAVADSLEAEHARVVAKMHVGTKDALAAKTVGATAHKILNPVAAMSVLGRTESVFAEYGKRTGSTLLYDTWTHTTNARRLLNTYNRQMVPFADRIIRGNSVTERERMGTLLWVDKVHRAETAQRLYGTALTREDLQKIDEAEAVLNTFLDAHGLGDFSSLTAQRTDILAKVEELKKKGGLDVAQSARDVLEGCYGAQVPRSLELFTEGVSKGDFLNYLADRDIGDMLLSTFDRVNKMKVYKPLQQELSRAWVEAKRAVDAGTLDKSALEFFGAALDESFGLKTATGERFASSMTALSQRFADLLSKSKTLTDLGFPQEVRTDDLIGKLGEIFTVNSQAWRVWSIPRNLTQVSLLGAIIGNGTAWRAFQHVVDHPEYVEKLYARGALQESIMAMGNESVTPLRRVLKLGLHPMEVADSLTRGACARAAEDLVEQAARRLSGGHLEGPQLVRELQADLLDAPAQERLVAMFQAGDLRGAADLLGQGWQSLTQFDYARGSSGSATWGVIGRLFGKLGVYPLHTIDLYRRILTEGSGGARAERAARLVATSTALYLACEAVGISYSGFLATDPFAFSGGPYWTAMNDALNSVGNQPENAVARARLRRNVPRMLLPTAMWWPYVGKAQKAAENGDVRGLLLALSTAPAVKEEGLMGEFRSGPSGFGEFGR